MKGPNLGSKQKVFKHWIHNVRPKTENSIFDHRHQNQCSKIGLQIQCRKTRFQRVLLQTQVLLQENPPTPKQRLFHGHLQRRTVEQVPLFGTLHINLPIQANILNVLFPRGFICRLKPRSDARCPVDAMDRARSAMLTYHKTVSVLGDRQWRGSFVALTSNKKGAAKTGATCC